MAEANTKKILHYRRHSLKETGTRSNYISQAGLDLALDEGCICATRYAKAFHGPLVRTASTLLAFLWGRRSNQAIMPVVEEIGNDKIIAAIVNDAFKTAQATGKNNYEALLASHNEFDVDLIAAFALMGLNKMFDAMQKGETAIAFGHSPIIELCAAGMNQGNLPEGWNQMGELDGLVFEQDASGEIRVIEVIRAKRD